MPVVLKLTVTKASELKRGLDFIWNAIRELSHRQGTFTPRDIIAMSDGQPRAVVRNYLDRLGKGGYLVRVGAPGVGQRPTTWQARRLPVARPRVSLCGESHTRGLARQQMWNVMRGPMGRSGFTVKELSGFAATDTVPVSHSTATRFVRILAAAGYLNAVGRVPGSADQRWRLKPSMNTGPQPPIIVRAGEIVFDQNRHAVVGEPIATETER